MTEDRVFIGSGLEHPKPDNLLTCEYHNPERERALIAIGDITKCPMCATTFLVSVAQGVAYRMHQRTLASEKATDAPPSGFIAAGLLLKAFESVSRGRWKPEQMHVVALSHGRETTVDADHPPLPPAAFERALIEVNTSMFDFVFDDEHEPKPTAKPSLALVPSPTDER